MHRLHLLRHAKSGRSEDVEDHERQLSRRGREAARLVGRDLPAAVGALDLVLCSSARRTRETMELVLAAFSPRPRAAVEDGLYLAGTAVLIKRLSALPEEDDNVLVIGHNPGLHELAMALAAAESPCIRALAAGKFPTMARASLEIASRWAGINRTRHPLVDYATPKSPGEDS